MLRPLDATVIAEFSCTAPESVNRADWEIKKLKLCRALREATDQLLETKAGKETLSFIYAHARATFESVSCDPIPTEILTVFVQYGIMMMLANDANHVAESNNLKNFFATCDNTHPEMLKPEDQNG